MQQSFPDNYEAIAASMGISLYQRFTVNEASLFLRCSVDDVKRLQRQGKIDHVQITSNKFEFFGFQLLDYLLKNVKQKTRSFAADDKFPDRIIRAREVQDMTGLSRTTLWRMENNGTFPRRVSLGVGSVGWRLSEISQWMEERNSVS